MRISVAAIVLCSAFCISWPALAQETEVTNICNYDGSQELYYTVMEESWRGKNVHGWFEIPPNRCVSVWKYAAENREYHYVLRANGKQLDMFWEGSYRGDAYCVNFEDVNDYVENLLDNSRASDCRPGETFVTANYRSTYDESYNVAYGIDTLNIPAWSGGGADDDGQVCGLVCVPWPGMETSHLKEAALAEKSKAATPSAVETAEPDAVPATDLNKQALEANAAALSEAIAAAEGAKPERTAGSGMIFKSLSIARCIDSPGCAFFPGALQLFAIADLLTLAPAK